MIAKKKVLFLVPFFIVVSRADLCLLILVSCINGNKDTSFSIIAKIGATFSAFLPRREQNQPYFTRIGHLQTLQLDTWTLVFVWLLKSVFRLGFYDLFVTTLFYLHFHRG